MVVAHGLPMDHRWVTHGSPMGLPWVSHGSPMGLPWVSHGSPVGLPWVSHGSPMGLPWVSHGSPMAVCPMGLPEQKKNMFVHNPQIPVTSHSAIMNICRTSPRPITAKTSRGAQTVQLGEVQCCTTGVHSEWLGPPITVTLSCYSQ